MKIVFWADYVCPYSYIGVSEMLNVLEQSGLPCELVMRAYLLDPKAATDNPPRISENFAAEDGPEAGKHMASIEKLAETGHVPISLAGAPFASSIGAHRLTKWAAGQLDQQAMRALIRSIYRAVFLENRNIADHQLLSRIAAECGLDPAAAAAMLETEAGRAEVFADTAAGDKVLEVIPYFTSGEHVLTGELTPAKVSAFLADLESAG